MADEIEHPALLELRRRLEDEEASYAEALAALDRLAAFPLPEETGPEVRDLLGELNGLWPAAPRPDGGGLGEALDRRAFDALAPVIDRQARFNAVLVRLLNAHLEHGARHHARLREMSEALVRYAQRVEPVIDARDDMRVARAPTGAEQVLEVFGRRLDAMQGRLEGLLALRDRLEVLSEEVRALREGLLAQAPPPQVARSAARAAADSTYTAFENRFRGSREDVRARQADYVALLRGQGPVVDLGCGRGEFLDLLRAAGIEARGVEGNAHAVRECRGQGPRRRRGRPRGVPSRPGSGPPRRGLRRAGGGAPAPAGSRRAPRRGPPRAAAGRAARAGDGEPGLRLGFLDVFIRDLTHERPLHPETLRFLAAAAGFSEARIQMRSPVPDDVRLHLLPGGGLPPPVVKALNENVERLNALLFAPVDYALVARR